MEWNSTSEDIAWQGADVPGAVFDKFFAGYDRAFILPDEKEDRSGFKACLALNGCSFGWSPHPAREVILIGVDRASGERLVGANFLATRIDARIALALNYVYVESEARGRGLLRRALDAVSEAARAYLDAPALPVTFFIEKNDPLRLTAEQYAADSAHSGIDQIDRLAVWARLGARLVDLDYVQPPLSAGQEADRGLVYAALRHDAPALDGAFLSAHLISFFGISVFKGENPKNHPEGARQIAAALAAPTILLYPMEPAIAALRADSAPIDESLLDLARRLGR